MIMLPRAAEAKSNPSRRMKKVYRNAPAIVPLTPAFSSASGNGRRDAAVLTVWCKSLLFNGSGFTVFDAAGNLAFRVENYSSCTKDDIVLMDASGKPLVTVRRKKLSLGEHWQVYEGEEAVNPRFSVKKHVSLLHYNSKALAHVTSCSAVATDRMNCSAAGFEVEGSYARRSCTVYGDGRRELAEIRQKKATPKGVAFGPDVFHLVVQPGFDAAVAMAIVIPLDQMFGSGGSALGNA